MLVLSVNVFSAVTPL